MENENSYEFPSTGASVGFALGFWIFYVIIVFCVLGIFFKFPF